MTADEHFAKAATGDRDEAVQNPVQHAHASCRKQTPAESPETKNPRNLLAHASSCNAVREGEMEDRGLEPLTF